jgi:hypothetical protein
MTHHNPGPPIFPVQQLAPLHDESSLHPDMIEVNEQFAFAPGRETLFVGGTASARTSSRGVMALGIIRSNATPKVRLQDVAECFGSSSHFATRVQKVTKAAQIFAQQLGTMPGRRNLHHSVDFNDVS